MKSLVLRFQTSALVPAPYAHAIELSLNLKNDSLAYVFEMEYLDRSQLSEDEIYEEGFTMEDDYKLEGELPKVWAEELKSLIEKTEKTFLEELEDEQEFWDIEVEKTNFYPKNHPQWKAFLEEFQQAVIEQNKLENPLQITVLRIDNELTNTFNIKGFFENKTLAISKNGEEKSLPWQKLKPLLKDYYSAEFDFEKATEKFPKKTGLFINFGDEWWFELGKSILTKPSKITSWLEN
ncbi:hypothetical protein EGI22_12365 [Lacihabitans sp. LS3-19]|uniref:hypothetical protein n=1 Tax=Lacihabitans sp. LS3-19 TaxID=2487335 RepID=UPI0020CEA34A|nr:hypothetical protein [Lacihabitans sp. LS3-19]MCP9768711.1 hypothetical protein [Lacihabitans sp. LS3-19]